MPIEMQGQSQILDDTSKFFDANNINQVAFSMQCYDYT